MDTISGHDTLVGNDGRGSFGWVGLVCHANQLIRKEPRGEVCQGSDGDLEAYDLTRCAHSAALLVGCDEKTVTRYVAVRDAGRDVGEWERRSRMIDPFLSKIEELVEASQGRIRADVVHEKLTAMGFSGTDRTTRRAVAEAKTAYRDGHRRKYRP